MKVGDKLDDPRLVAIRQTLRHEWNPIGLHEGDPEDEYDDYAPRVFEVLSSGVDALAAAAQIASYLTWVRVYMMQLRSCEACRRDAAAANALVAKYHGA